MTRTTEVTTENFAALVEAPGVVLLDFWAAWCGPCRAFAPVFEAAAARHPDAVFGKVDVDAQPELAAEFGVRSIPTLAVLRDSVLVFAQPGMVPGGALDELIRKVRALDMDDVRRRIAASEKATATAAAAR